MTRTPSEAESSIINYAANMAGKTLAEFSNETLHGTFIAALREIAKRNGHQAAAELSYHWADRLAWPYAAPAGSA